MADDLNALLAEVDIRAPNDSGRWSGNYKLMMSDPSLARALAAAVRDLQAAHQRCGPATDTLRQARERFANYDANHNQQTMYGLVADLRALLVDGDTDG